MRIAGFLFSLAMACVVGALAATSSVQPSGVAPGVVIRRVPHGGIQPDALRDGSGTLHLLYYAGEPSAGDLFYVRSDDDGQTFSNPLRVNSQPASAIAAGTIRGGQLAIGKRGRVHVVWNGSGKALPAGQFFYARLDGAGRAFEAQRGLMQRSTTLDGGGSIAADADGNVYAVWHGNDAQTRDRSEASRRVWIARSFDDGRSFAAEAAASDAATGACGCCGMRAFSRGNALYVLYRSAAASVHRDVFLLTSQDKGATFASSRVHRWDINACPMTSMSIGSTTTGVLGAWETDGEVYFAALEGRGNRTPTGPSPGTKGQKHPRLAISENGDTLLVWTEGTAWSKGGSLAWQVSTALGQRRGETERRGGVPVWSFATAVAGRNGGFTILY